MGVVRELLVPVCEVSEAQELWDPGSADERSRIRARSGKLCDYNRQSFQQKINNGCIEHSTIAWQCRTEQDLPCFVHPQATIETARKIMPGERYDILHTASRCIGCKENRSLHLSKPLPSCRTRRISCWDCWIRTNTCKIATYWFKFVMHNQ